MRAFFGRRWFALCAAIKMYRYAKRHHHAEPGIAIRCLYCYPMSYDLPG